MRKKSKLRREATKPTADFGQPQRPPEGRDVLIDLSQAVLGLGWPRPMKCAAARRTLRAFLLTLSVLGEGPYWEEEDDENRAYVIFEQERRLQWCELWPMLHSGIKVRRSQIEGIWKSLGGSEIEVVARHASVPWFLRMKQCMELGAPGYEIYVNSARDEGIRSPGALLRDDQRPFTDI